jgi:CRP/FNR family transcriptional regulator, nitrogen fixation regulation protein
MLAHAHAAVRPGVFHPAPHRSIRSAAKRVEPAQNRAGTSTDGVGEPLAESMRLMGAAMSFPRNSEIFGEAEAADYLYKVISGCIRSYRILSDGRRQITGFYLPGEVFGLASGAEHTESAEAIADSKVAVLKRGALEALADRNPAIGRELFALTGRELRRAQNRILLLVESAQERVVGFLLEMAERLNAERTFELPMSRQDIADYLGLTIETVSRTLTALADAAAIEVGCTRRIVLRNRAALAAMIG